MTVPAGPSNPPREAPGLMRPLLALFMALTLIGAVPLYFARRAANEASPFHIALLYGALSWVLWLLAAPAILWLGRRFDFRAGSRGRSLLIHALAATVMHALSGWGQMYSALKLFGRNPAEAISLEMYLRSLANGTRISLTLLIYAGLLGIDRALRTARALRERELQAVRLEAQATRAHLAALGARLQPHFLFNALQSVSALVDEEPARARTMLAEIGDLLRDVLASGESGEIPLREELALLDRYLAIERTRFADRLRIEIVAAPEVGETPVPRFLLQPLVENALRHGLAPRPEGGRLRVTAERRDGRLRLRVWNDGEALRAGRPDGVGLATTRERLAARYGTTATLHLGAVDGGVEAVVELPA